MPVTVRTRVRPVGSAESHVEETVILREGKVVAALPEGDPLLYLLSLPVRRLRTMKKKLAPVLKRRRFEGEVFDAILEYREARVARAAAGPRGT